MEVSVTHAPSGQGCVVCVADTDTVLDLKARALQQLFPSHTGTSSEASVSARIGRGSEGANLEDTQRIADTALEDGGDVQLVRYCATAKAPATYSVEPQIVHGIGLSRCGRLCAVGTFSGCVFVFDTTTASQVTHLKYGTTIINCIAFSRCGTKLASGSRDSTVHVTDTATWQQKCPPLQQHSECAKAVAWTHCGRLVSGSADKTLRVWDAERGACTAVLEGHSGSVNGVAASAAHIFSASSDMKIRVWDIGTLGHTTTLTGHVGWVCDVRLNGDERLLVSCAKDTTAKVWCTASLTCLYTVRMSSERSCGIAVSQEADMAVLCDTATRLWCLTTQTQLCDLGVQPRCPSWGIALSPCGRWMYSSQQIPSNQTRVHVVPVGDVPAPPLS